MASSQASTDALVTIAEAAERRRDVLVADLVQMVARETPSDNVALLDAGLAEIEGWLERTVKAPAARERVGGAGAATHLVLDYPSAQPSTSHPAEESGAGSGWVTVLCHYDTVWAAGTASERPATLDGDRITGPGAYDMKGGLVQFAHALALLDELGIPRPHVRLVLNGDEELGSLGSRDLIEQTALRGGPVLVFEAAAYPGGDLKTGRKGVGLFEVTVRGVETHAGSDPEGGASAIDELARLILQLHAAADLAAGTSVNVGVISGGTRRNVRAGHAEALVDVRVSSAPEAERVERVLAALAPHNPRAAVTVTGGWNRPVMERTPGNVALFEVAREAAEELGFSVKDLSVGGASDGNFAAALGKPVLDGLGAVGDGAHARHEWVSVDGLVQRTALAAVLLSRL